MSDAFWLAIIIIICTGLIVSLLLLIHQCICAGVLAILKAIQDKKEDSDG